MREKQICIWSSRYLGYRNIFIQKGSYVKYIVVYNKRRKQYMRGIVLNTIKPHTDSVKIEFKLSGEHVIHYLPFQNKRIIKKLYRVFK